VQRREVLELLAAAVLPPLIPRGAGERLAFGERLHAGIVPGQAGRALAAGQLAQVRALADAIIPGGDPPGALEVHAPEFVDLLLAEWYADPDRDRLLAGLDALEARCRAAHGRGFAELDGAGRAAFLSGVDGIRGETGSPEAAYAQIKDQLVFAWLTSRPIAELTRTTPIVPGRFDGCVPLRTSR